MTSVDPLLTSNNLSHLAFGQITFQSRSNCQFGELCERFLHGQRIESFGSKILF